MYLLCLYTGLRLGEVCALRRTDVDFENGSISVRGALRRVRSGNSTRSYLEVGAPKSDCSERDIPVPTFLLARLKAFRAQDTGVYVFAGAHGLPLDPRTVQGRFKRFLAPLGIKNAHMHTLRHTYATRCLEQGVGCDVLCELLGHSSPKVTLSFYAHCTLEQKRNCVGRLKMLA